MKKMFSIAIMVISLSVIVYAAVVPIQESEPGGTITHSKKEHVIWCKYEEPKWDPTGSPVDFWTYYCDYDTTNDCMGYRYCI